MAVDPKIFEEFDEGWALLTAGSFDSYNAMTISWGGVGTLWGLPVATVYVRPNRYTHEFMEKSNFFTVSFFPKQYRSDLDILGTKSGRDGDKIALTSLTPVSNEGWVTFKEAQQTLLCQKIYRQEMDPDAIPRQVKTGHYRTEPVHTMYVGQVIEILNKKVNLEY